MSPTVATAASAASAAMASGDDSWRNRLRDLDEALVANITPQDGPARLARLVATSHWHRVYDARLREVAPMVESSDRRFGVLATEFAPADPGRYLPDLLASLSAVCEAISVFSAESISEAEVPVDALLTPLVRSFTLSVNQNMNALAHELRDVLKESDMYELATLAKLNDFMADTLAEARAARNFAQNH